MKKKKLAIFDVDGTLFDGNLGILMLKNLLKHNLFNPTYGNEILNWFQKYKDGSVEKAVVVDEIYKLYVLGMTGNKVDEIEKIADLTWDEVKTKAFNFTQGLINRLKIKNYEVILISGSNIEIISRFGKYNGVEENNIIAGKIEIIDGVYSGKLINFPGSDKQKEELLLKLISSRLWKVDWNKSLAMGNNERDKRILELCGISIAFEPNDILENEALKHGWKIYDRNSINAFTLNVFPRF
jgi:phosphoserine phosphatase